jgi:tetratricopeptide (TPR) repeat protein
MNIFRKKSGNKGQEHTPPAEVDPVHDPNMIRVYDSYGRELFMTRQEWRDKVLLANLERNKGNPEELYNLLVGALRDGFAADVVPYAELFYRTDNRSARAASILGVAYIEANRLDEAQRVFGDFLAAHGDDGLVLTNLAHVYDRRGDRDRAESILWHALEVDPNQENGFGWYTSIERERGGAPAALGAWRRIGRLPNSWRAQIWLAQGALEKRDLAAAEQWYVEALARAGRPVPTDLLQQMSSDLGRNGYLAEIIRLVEPHFDIAYHGLEVGNNLIKAHFDLGQLDGARALVNRLYAQKRPDWKETLNYWDTELAKARIAQQAEPPPPGKLPVTVIANVGPLWALGDARFAALVPSKSVEAPMIAIFGSTVLSANAAQRPGAQLSNRPGSLSRAIPLHFAERIHLTTNAVGVAMIPWVEDRGFALFGSYNDLGLSEASVAAGNRPSYVVGIILDTIPLPWRIMLRVVKRVDGSQVFEVQVDAAAENPGPTVGNLADTLVRRLAETKIVSTHPAPAWYQVPAGIDFSNYLLRLEQQLAVSCMHDKTLRGGGLSGEHEILDGIVQLCASQPANPLVRMVLVQTLRHMRKVRPEILPEYTDKLARLQREHPISGDVGELIEKEMPEIMGKM